MGVEKPPFILCFSGTMTPFAGKSPMKDKVGIPEHKLRHLPYLSFLNLDIREFSPTSWRSIIGVVPQDPILFTGSIADNIAFGNPSATRAQIEGAAREANCEFIWGMPNGFDTESMCDCNVSGDD